MPDSDKDHIMKISLFHMLELEREEILKHKWIESQKAGHDIGFERALISWMVEYRAAWRRQFSASPSHYEI